VSGADTAERLALLFRRTRCASFATGNRSSLSLGVMLRGKTVRRVGSQRSRLRMQRPMTPAGMAAGREGLTVERSTRQKTSTGTPAVPDEY